MQTMLRCLRVHQSLRAQALRSKLPPVVFEPQTCQYRRASTISCSTVPWPAMHARRVTTRAAAEAAVTAPTVPSTQTKDDVQGAMLEPSVVNKNWVRVGAVLAGVSAFAGSTAYMPGTLVTYIHLMAFAVFFGTNFWNSFFVGITMFKNMPRQMFGRVQSKLFPLYFGLTTSCNIVLLSTTYLAAAQPTPQLLAPLGVSLGASLANWLLLEPKCTTLMFQRYAIENKEEKTESDQNEIKALYKQFGMWHGISSLVNLVVFVGASVHGWSLASKFLL